MQAAFRQWRRDLSDVVGEGRYKWFFEQTLCLELIIGEATTVDIPELSYQAIYQDAFSPEANPELWTESFFARLYPLLEVGGRLATYSVKGTVRRKLQAVGFTVQKQPGPPGKRKILVAIK
jgi:tRNA U34 5-methylaminomethyl-2-thiouridine-forming methyltransferase MnmC